MKKIAAIAIAAALVSGMAFAAGPVSISIDAKTDVWSKNGDAKGMKTDINYEDYLGQMIASYDTDVGGGMLRFWVNNNAASQGSAAQSVWGAQNSLFLNRWSAYIKPAAGIKVGMMTAPYEVFAENNLWDPIFAAALFETGTPKLYAEYTAIKNLTVVAGVDNNTYGTANDKPNKTFGSAVKYDIAGLGSVSAMFENRNNGDTDGAGKAQVIGGTFTYSAIQNVSVLVGYAGIMNDDAKDRAKFAQNRLEGYVTYSAGAFAASIYDGAVIRNKDYGDFGNRFAVKASYKLNDTFTPWCRVNYFTNYNARWGGLGLENELNGTEKNSYVRVEPMVSYSLGKGIGGYFGARINHNLTSGLDSGDRTAYELPLGITVDF